MKRSVTLTTSQPYEVNAFRRCLHDLRKDGIPWIPLVGRNSFLSSHPMSYPHTHEGCVEVLYCHHGTCDYESLGQVYRLGPGSVFVSRPDEPHCRISNPKGLSTRYLLFKLPVANSRRPVAREVAFLGRSLLKIPRLFDGGARVGSEFVRLFKLLECPPADPDERYLRLRQAVGELLLSVIDAAARKPLAEGVSGRVRALAREMETHPESDYPVDALSASIGFSPSSLLAAFKRTTGHTPHAYLVKCRIGRAKELLKGEKIAAVARTLGFSSSQHFSAQFKSATGLTPGEWMKTQQDAEVTI